MSALPSDVRIAVTGQSGVGKSTCAGFIEQFTAARGLTFARVKLATPLYELQRQVYAAAGRRLAEQAQDQSLMEALAGHLRRINPGSLADDFLCRLDGVRADVILNDDLRDPQVDAPALRASGFKVLRVHCAESIRRARLAQRGDPTLTDGSTAQLHLIAADAVIDSGCELDAYRARVEDLLRRWL